MLAALRQLDIVPGQVLIEATIAEISLTDNLSYGLEWFFRNEGAGLIGEGALGGLTAADIATGVTNTTAGFSYVLRGTDVRVVLNLLAEDSKLNIVSSPSLMVLNNQTANIRVGDEVPVQTQQRQSTDDVTAPQINNIEFRDTGVQLSVTPRVNAGGLVTLEIEQEVSNVQGTSDPASPNLTPTIFTREIATNVAVQSGETVVLGGLIEETRNDGKSGIPVLHRLPIVGPLFGTTASNVERTELVVLITPRAIGDINQARRVTEEFRNKFESLKPRDQQRLETPGT